MDRFPETYAAVFRGDLAEVIGYFQDRRVPVVAATHAQRFGDRVAPDERSLLVEWRSYYPWLKEDSFLDMERRMNQVISDVARERGGAPPGCSQSHAARSTVLRRVRPFHE